LTSQEKIIWDKDVYFWHYSFRGRLACWNVYKLMLFVLCVQYSTWYLRSWINETSQTICRYVQLAMRGFSTAELVCYLGNTVAE